MNNDLFAGVFFLAVAIFGLFVSRASYRDDEGVLSFLIFVLSAVALVLSAVAFRDYGARQDIELDTKWEPVVHYIHHPQTNTFDTVYIYKYENRVDNE